MPSIVNRQSSIVKNSVKTFTRLSSVLCVGVALFGEVSFAANCSYVSVDAGYGNGLCMCVDGGYVESQMGYQLGDNAAAGLGMSVQVCSSSSDTTCSVSLTAPVTAGVVYLKNTSSGATDYYKCTWTNGSGFSAGSAHTPSVAISAPIFNFNRPAEIFASEVEK